MCLTTQQKQDFEKETQHAKGPKEINKGLQRIQWVFHMVFVVVKIHLWHQDDLEQRSDEESGPVFGVHESPRNTTAVLFGWDITKTFCARNGLAMVVRSHQSKKYGLGFDLMHDEKLIRVFSARDYEGHCNDGAVLLVRPIADDEEQSYERPSCMSVRAQVLGSYAKALGHRGSAVPSSNGTAWQRGSGLGHCKMQVPLASIVGTWHRHVEFVVCRTVTGLYNRDRPCQSYLPQMWGNDVYPYQCRRKWLKRNLRTSCPSMTRTQTVFCFSRRTRECCTDLVPGKRRKPSRNYKNWRLWRRLWIFFGVGEYHCFGFVWHEIGQKFRLMDFCWLKWNFIGTALMRLWAAKNGICSKILYIFWWLLDAIRSSSRFCDAFPKSGDPKIGA